MSLSTKPDERLIQSFVFHKGRCFFVSTIDRDSSAILGPERYAETIVWDFDFEGRKSKSMMYQRDCCQGSVHQHLAMCKELFETGGLKPVD